MSTQLDYLADSEAYESDGVVVRVESNQFSPEVTLILDRTIFYPQGGGQPTDQGVVSASGIQVKINKVSFQDGEVLHIGPVIEGQVVEGQSVHLEINSEMRNHHARLHTGGHLVMTAVDRLLQFPAIKGYHFPNGPYVEFEGIIPPENREQALKDLQSILDSLIEENSEVTARFDTVENLRLEGVYMPGEVPEGKPTRVVTTAGYQSPCGGTHVKKLGQLSGLKIRGIKSKSGKTRISYEIL